MRWILASAALVAAHAAALAGDLHLSKLKVKQGRASDAVAVTGTLEHAIDLPANASLTLRCASFSQTLTSDRLEASSKKLSFKAAKGESGIRRFSLSFKTGAFSLTAAGFEAGDLSEPLAFSLEIGGQRIGALFPVKGRKSKRSWAAGQPVRVALTVKVLEVAHEDGGPLLRAADGVTFTPDSASAGDPFTVVSANRTVTGGEVSATLETKDLDGVGRIAFTQALGRNTLFTDGGLSRITAGSDGEFDAVVLVEDRGDAHTLEAAQPLVIDAPGGDGAPSGTLRFPAGAVTSELLGVRFTPLTFGAMLPAPLPSGFTAVAGAEIVAQTDREFEEGAGPTVELSRPSWVDAGSLSGRTILAFEFKGGEWSELAGHGAFDTATDRIGPEQLAPPRLTGTGAVVYAVGAEAPSKRRAGEAAADVHGRVVDGSGNPLPGQVIFTRNDVMVTGDDGAFALASSSLDADGLDVVQAIGRGTSVSRLLSASDAGDVELRSVIQPRILEPRTVTVAAYEAGGWIPSPGARITIREARASRGVVHDDGGTPGDLSDDVFSLPDLSELGVGTFSWNLSAPGDPAEFTAPQTASSIRLGKLVEDAADAGRSMVAGAFTVRVSYTVKDLGPVELYAGFRYSSDGTTAWISDIQLPAPVETTPPRTVVTGANGSVALSLEGVTGQPMIATAQRADAARTDRQPFAIVPDVKVDLVFEADPAAPTPAGLAYGWNERTPMPTPRAHPGTAGLGGLVWVAGGLAASGPTAALEAYDPIADAWTAKASMGTQRDRAPLVSLGGKLYCVGGSDGASALSSVERFDPATGAWSAVAPMSAARVSPGACAAGGRLHVFGGTSASGAPLSSVEVYDPAADTWSPGISMPFDVVPIGAAVVTGSLIHVASPGPPAERLLFLDPVAGNWQTRPNVRIEDSGLAEMFGSVFAVGGDSGAVPVYSTVSNTWGTVTPLGAGRRELGAASVNGILYGVGGAGPSARTQALRLVWRPRSSMAAAREDLAAAALNGRVYAAGGRLGATTSIAVEVFEPARNVWRPRAAMPAARDHFALVALDGKLYAIGGSQGAAATALASVDVYDPVANAWTACAPMSKARAGVVAGAIGGKIYAAGGAGDATTEVYDPSTDSWTPRAPMSVPRTRAAAVVVGTGLLVIGGNDGTSALTSCEMYDSVTDVWTSRTELPRSRESHGAVLSGGKVWVLGGWEAGYGNESPALLSYEPSLDAWTEKSGFDLPEPRGGIGMAALDGILYVAGGRQPASHGQTVFRTVVSHKPE